jgi:hypothetical protein
MTTCDNFIGIFSEELLLHIYNVFQWLKFFKYAKSTKLPYNRACHILDPKCTLKSFSKSKIQSLDFVEFK